MQSEQAPIGCWEFHQKLKDATSTCRSLGQGKAQDQLSSCKLCGHIETKPEPELGARVRDKTGTRAGGWSWGPSQSQNQKPKSGTKPKQDLEAGAVDQARARTRSQSWGQSWNKSQRLEPGTEPKARAGG